jgi:cell wall-associated NlpC family hydrolase
MLRLVTMSVLLAAAFLTACGSTADVGSVQAWNAQPPYLPPPDPSLFARAGAHAAATNGKATTPKPAPKAPRTALQPATGAPSDAEVAAQLREAFGGKGGTNVDQAAIDGSGLAITPPTAPPKLVALIRAANQVARKPYVYGGGHGRNPNEIWEDNAYDCSGSVSYALASAGYIDGPMDSTALAAFGKPGPGRWVTIYANAGHAFMVAAGLRFDTSGRRRTGTRWQSADARSYAGFTVRHPPGL